MTYKATTYYLRAGERIPEGEPKRYKASNGCTRLRWLVGVGQYVEAYEHRVLEDGTIAPSRVGPAEKTVKAECVKCGKVRMTRRRDDGTVPDKCRECFGNGQTKGEFVGRVDKHCWNCKTVRPASEFGPNPSKPDLLSTECNWCRRRMAREKYVNNKDRQRNQYLVKQYGITKDDYDATLAAQGGVCWICKKVCSSGKQLAVDHCHRTGRIRKLLCANCNRGLGYFGDDPDTLSVALQYLLDHSE